MVLPLLIGVVLLLVVALFFAIPVLIFIADILGFTSAILNNPVLVYGLVVLFLAWLVQRLGLIEWGAVWR